MTRRQLKRRIKRMRRRSTRQWRHFDTRQRTLVVAGAAVQITLFALAQIDLSKRSPHEIRGSKVFWRLVCLINFIGPLLYFAFGRRSPVSETEPAEPASAVA